MGDQLAREYWNYQRNASPEAHAETFQKFRRALEEQPECAILHAIVAELALDGCAVGLLDQCHGFDIAHASLERARKLDGDNPHLFVSMAFAAIAQGDLPAARQAASLLRQPSVEPALGAIGVWFESVCSSESGIGNGNLRAFERASDMISWLRLIEFLKAYRMRDYEKALSEAIWFGMPDFMWGPLLRAAAFGQLGLQSCALREIESLQSISPGFELRPLQYIKYYLPLDADAEHVLEGLQRAGL